jgi:hypothetical protein
LSKRELNLTAEAIRLLDIIYRWKDGFLVGDVHICRYCGQRVSWRSHPKNIRHYVNCIYDNGDLKAFFDRLDVGEREI